MKKKISIICPAYNSAKHIPFTIQSILNQSFKKFELIIVVDPSSDNTVEEIKKFKDKRIVLIINKSQIGLAASLNLGIKKSNSDLIARADSDDLYFKNRLMTQYNYLKKHPDIDLIGSNAIVVKKNKKLKFYQPTSDYLINWSMIFSCPFLHPTIMIRKKVFYKYGFYPSKRFEDYNFYLNLIGKIKYKNINNFLCILQRHEGNLSTLKNNRDVLEELKMYKKFILTFYKINLNIKLIKILVHGYNLGGNKKNIQLAICKIKELRKKFLELYSAEEKMVNIDTVIKIIFICIKNRSYLNLLQNIFYFYRLDPFFVYHLILKLINRILFKKIIIVGT